MPSKVGKSIGDTLGADGKDILQLLSGGAPKILEQGDLIRAVYPVSPIADSKAWAVVIDLPKQVLLADSVKLQAVLDDAQQSGTIKAVLVAVIAGLIGLLLIWLTASGVTRPINSVAEMLKAIASGDGDLTQRLHYSKQDELGELVSWFNRFLDKLQPTIAQIKQSITDARGTADQSSEIARQTSEGMQVQFREIDQVATASNEMSATAHDVANSASNAANAAKGADQSARDGMSIIERSTRDINQLADEVSKAVTEVEALGGQQRADRFGAGSDPQHRRTNQPAGAQRGDRSGPCRRERSRLCGGRRRSAQPGQTHPGFGGRNSPGDRTHPDRHPRRGRHHALEPDPGPQQRRADPASGPGLE